MLYPGWRVRDQLAPRFRFRLLDAIEMIPYFHQARVFAYLDVKELSLVPTCDLSDVPQLRDKPALRTWIDGTEHWLITVPRHVEIELEKYGEPATELVPAFDGDLPVVDYRYFAVVPSDRQRPRVVSISGSFKLGKSVFGGIVPSSFGICPDLKWDVYGTEYDICEPEFEYILDCFLGEAGLNLPKADGPTGSHLRGWLRWKNDPALGRMYLELSNGARYTCRSLRKALETKTDPLKGKERDGFSVAEVYQFPSIQSLLSYRQNLAVRQGYYIMPSTPDRPIMDEVNMRSDPENDEFPTWIGVSEVHRRENPYAFVLEDFYEDLKTFSQEEFTVYWEGKSGRWIGSVYPPVQYFDTETHPFLWHDPKEPPTVENFAPPPWMMRRGAYDAGTLYGIVTSVCDDLSNIFVLDGQCNYRYVTGQIEQRHEITVESVCSRARMFRAQIGGKWGADITDHNTQWRGEYRRWGIRTRKGKKNPEHRTEVTRGMAQNGFIWFAPWMQGSALVLEYQAARYPPKEMSTKKKRRIDQNDHLLDCLEHICAMHPKALKPRPPDKQNPVRALLTAKRRLPSFFTGDPQMGA